VRPFYWQGTTNFGDAMNAWLWSSLFPNLISADDETRLVGVGTLIRSELKFIGDKIEIFGSGLGYGDTPAKELVSKWKIHCVRGPLTAKTLGIDEKYAVVDGAWLISLIPEFRSIPEKKRRVFVPHWTSARDDAWTRVCEDCDLEYVNPLADSKKVIHQIATSELAIVESLHGAIIADYFRTPWIPIRTSERILSFKWLDWCASVGLDYCPVHLPAPGWISAFSNVGTSHIGAGANRYVSEGPARPEPDRRRALPELKQKLKPLARRLRAGVVNGVQRARNIWPVSIWHEQQVSKAVQKLKHISAGKSFLSADATRETKIEQLAIAAEAFRKDHSRA
jgi:succinoglycan biosynthesis protein ExoV